MGKPKNKKGFFASIKESELIITIARDDGAGIFQIYEPIERKKYVLNRLIELKKWIEDLIIYLEKEHDRD